MLNETRGVSGERRQRVLAAVEQLGYVPNILAQTLRRTRSHVVGLCIPHAVFNYFVSLAETIEGLAAVDGYDVMHIFSRQDRATELRRIEMLLKHKIDGMVLLSTATPQEALNRLADAAILDRPVDDRRLDQAIVDLRAATATAAQSLIGLGHRRVLFVTGDQRWLISQRRIDGIRQALRQAGCGGSLRVLDRANEPDGLQRQLAPILQGEAPPTAIIASNSLAVGWVLQAVRRLGFRCPQDVWLIGADEPRWAEFVEPPLAVIRAPAEEVVRHGWSMLRARMESEPGRPKRITLEAKLRSGGTIGPAPA